MRQQVSCFSGNPLQNRTVLLVCSEKKLAAIQGGLESMGGTILPFPILKAKEIEDPRLMDAAIASLSTYTWIIFTSAYGVAFFARHLQQCRKKVRPAMMPKICTIGPATAEAAREAGFVPTLIPDKFIAEGVLDALAQHHKGIENLAGLKVLIPRAMQAREFLPEALIAAGACVHVVPCYTISREEMNPDILKRLLEKRPDLIVFTSASTIKNMIEILGQDYGLTLLREATVAVIGPVTGDAAASYGKDADIVPKESTVPALLDAIAEYFVGDQPAL
jgi:uroporphyrinogen III methyltransferase/synthase